MMAGAAASIFGWNNVWQLYNGSAPLSGDFLLMWRGCFNQFDRLFIILEVAIAQLEVANKPLSL
jgi:hypothetical protein